MNIHYGDWNIVRKIGSGSFGIVYEIERESFGFHQKAALKVISIPQSQNDVASIRNTGMDEASIGDYYRDLATEIVKELQTMEQLKGHTNIVSYEDHEIRPKAEGVGWDIYIRMELLTPLQKYLSEHQMNRDEVIHLGIDLCRALERCESLNIIHRDIKPDNIFLSKQGDGKLGDFGIARSAERTMSGMSRKGTFGFMAPEVYKGQPYGKTVDIYSLGLVLYRLLNNNRGPFLPPYPQPIKYQDQSQALARRIKGERLPVPAQADETLADVVLRACSYDPKQRFSTAEEMRLALEDARDTASNKETVPVQSEEGEFDARPELYDDATICGGDLLIEDCVESTLSESEAASENVKDAASHLSDQEEISFKDDDTVSSFHPQQDIQAADKQILDEETVSAFTGPPRVEKRSEEGDENPVSRPEVVDDRTVSVFNLSSEQGNSDVPSAKEGALTDERTVSIFSQPEKQSQPKEELQQASKQTPAPVTNKGDHAQNHLRQREQQEEEERAKRERAAKKKKRNNIIAVAAVMIGLIVAVTALSTSLKTNNTPVNATQQNEKEIVSIQVPYKKTEMIDSQKKIITITIDDNNKDYMLSVDWYPLSLLRVGQESVTHNALGQDIYVYNVTPILPAGESKRHVSLDIVAVSKDGKRTVYDRGHIDITITAS